MKRFLLGIILGVLFSLALQKGPKCYKEYLAQEELSEDSAKE